MTLRKHNDVIDPRDWGVRFDGVTDDSDAWAALLSSDALGASDRQGRTLLCPQGVTIISEELQWPSWVRTVGQGRDATCFHAVAGNGPAMIFRNNVYSTFEHLTMRSLAGSGKTIFRVRRESNCRHHCVIYAQENPDLPAWDFDPNFASGGVFFSQYDQVRFEHTDDATVPTYRAVSPEPVIMNANVFRNILFLLHGPGSHAMLISSTARNQNNQFDTITGEILEGGLLKFVGSGGNVFINPTLYDTAGMTHPNHIMHFERARANTIIGYDRRDGTLAAGMSDLYFDDASLENVVISLGERGNGYNRTSMHIDFSGTSGVIDGFRPYAAYLRNGALVNARGRGWTRTGAGPTAERPGFNTNRSAPGDPLGGDAAQFAGAMWFDTDLGHAIWWNGAAWVDALGNLV